MSLFYACLFIAFLPHGLAAYTCKPTESTVTSSTKHEYLQEFSKKSNPPPPPNWILRGLGADTDSWKNLKSKILYQTPFKWLLLIYLFHDNLLFAYQPSPMHFTALPVILLLASLPVKKAFRYSRPQPGRHLPNSPWAGIIYIWRHNSCPGRDWYVWDGNIEKMFLRWY